MLGFFKLLSLEAIGYVAIGNLIIKKLWEYITLGFTIGTPSFIQSNMNYLTLFLVLCFLASDIIILYDIHLVLPAVCKYLP